MKINYRTVKEFGDHDTIGRLEDGRFFWAWNLGEAREPEKLLEMGPADGENGGEVFESLDELLSELDECRPNLADDVRKHFED